MNHAEAWVWANVCPACRGTGYEVVGVAPMPTEGYETGQYEPEACDSCNGTGRVAA